MVLGPVAHDDRMIALDQDQAVDQLLVTTNLARDYRPGDGNSRSVAYVTKPVVRRMQAP